MLFSYRSEESGLSGSPGLGRLSAGQGDPCGMYVLGRALIYEFRLGKTHGGRGFLDVRGP